MKNANSNKTESLPSWDLSEFYPSYESELIDVDLENCEKIADKLNNDYKGKMADLNSEQFYQMIEHYEEYVAILNKVSSYAQLLFSVEMENEQIANFYQNINETLNDIGSKTIFISLEINKLSEDTINQLLEGKAKKYAPYVRDIRVFKDHELSEELENYAHEKELTSCESWVRFFNETLSKLKFRYKSEEVNITEILNMVTSNEEEVRKEAAINFGKTLGENIKTFSFIMNTLAKDKAIDDKWRKFKEPISSRNLANLIEDEVVENLISTVKKNYANLSHRYYKKKAKIFGSEKLDYWNRNAPYPESDEKYYSFKEAKEIVLEAYGEFSPKMAEIGQIFFDKNWIDAGVKDGKESGAFSHPCSSKVNPKILLNYQGKVRDIMTLAHELGHGVHQYLSKEQGQLLSDTPLTLAETASVFGEQLTFRKLLKKQTDETARKYLIAGKVEDMLNTVVRQIAFCDFEKQVHAERKNGELPSDRICEIWLEKQRESLGDAIIFGDEYKYYWAYISHFIHVPFYVYAYGFGDCLVNSLYANYEKKPENFEEKYIEMLRAGGTLRHYEMLAPFGLDTRDKNFWQGGMDIISSYIDQI